LNPYQKVDPTGGDTDAAVGRLKRDCLPNDVHPLVLRMKGVLKGYPEMLEDFVQMLEKGSLGIPIDRANNEDWLRNLGLNPAYFDCDAIRNKTPPQAKFVPQFAPRSHSTGSEQSIGSVHSEHGTCQTSSLPSWLAVGRRKPPRCSWLPNGELDTHIDWS
jgi:hypothetical protein